jgi:hypothetical protein
MAALADRDCAVDASDMVVLVRQFSKTAWDIASQYSNVLASETRDLAAQIDDALNRQWQPIETAPKDGTRILAYEITDADDTQPQIVCWLDEPDKPGWYICFDHTPCHGEIWKPPTHWQPIPEPPK